MKVATKFVSALTPEEMTHLQHLLDTAVAKRVRRRAGQVLFLVEIIEAGGFNQQQSRLASPYRVSSPSPVRA